MRPANARYSDGWRLWDAQLSDLGENVTEDECRAYNDRQRLELSEMFDGLPATDERATEIEGFIEANWMTWLASVSR